MSKAKWTTREGVHRLKGERCQISLTIWPSTTHIDVQIGGKWHHTYTRETGEATKRHARVLFNAIEGKA